MSAARALLACLLPILVHAATATAVTPSGAAPHRARLAARDLFADRMWDDGRAEYSVYRGTIVRYGTSRPLSARIIVVKEDMDLAQRVKSEFRRDPDAMRTILKMIYSQDFATGTYDYHQMTSTFLDRATGRLETLAMSSQDGCGTTFSKTVADGRLLNRVSHSYWDRQADRNETEACDDCANLVVADALPLWLRRLDLARLQSITVRLLPSQLSNGVGPLATMTARIEVAGRADRHGFPVWVRYVTSGRADRYWFAPAWPHGLVRFEGGNDPTVLERVKSVRLAYWQKTAPGDERLLAP